MHLTQFVDSGNGQTDFTERELTAPTAQHMVNVLYHSEAKFVDLIYIAPAADQFWVGSSGSMTIVVSGGVTLRTSDGKERQFGVGDVLMVDNSPMSWGHMLHGGEAASILALVQLKCK